MLFAPKTPFMMCDPFSSRALAEQRYGRITMGTTPAGVGEERSINSQVLHPRKVPSSYFSILL